MVLSAQPIGEYDKRVVVLTRERGKITAFAKGARRQTSQLLAASTPFSFGTFLVYEGRTSYNLQQAEISNYFYKLKEDLEAVSYGFYFLEFTEYYTRENNDELQMLKLLYQSIRALEKENFQKQLIRYIFELKSMVVNGEYPEVFQCIECKKMIKNGVLNCRRGGMLCMECKTGHADEYALQDSTIYTLQYIIASSIEKLYTFKVSEEVLAELKKIMKRYMSIYTEYKFHSLEMLDTLLS